MDGKSLDIKKERIDKLKGLMPEVFSEENNIDFEKLKLSLGENINTENERYVLNWAGKGEAFKVLQTQTTATLAPDNNESINFDTTENIFIEGENLEVLKVLQKSYYGKIKMIYIDPPYNTGNDSFIYPDKFSESKDEYLKRIGEKDEEGFMLKEGLFRKNSKESGRYHSNWLSMMYPRLFLARNLLLDDGVIFVSIDDNEVHNLRMMMNEIFGEENFLAEIVWQHSLQPKGYLEKFSIHHNYVLCYQKSSKYFLNPLERTEEHNKNYSNPDNDINGPWRSGDVRNALYRPNLIFDIETPSGKKIKPSKNGWRWSKVTINEKINSGEIIFNKDETRIIRKIYLNKLSGRTPETIWFGKNVGTTREGVEQIKKLFEGQTLFDTIKPTNLIREMLLLGTNNNSDDIVLDFFSGSGTTAHAILELNKEDVAKRKFILVQLPEKTIEDSEAYKAGYKTIADICKERIRRVIKNLETENKNEQLSMAKGMASRGRENDKSADLGFKVFKLKNSNFKLWRGDVIENDADLARQLDAFEDPLKKDAEELNIVYEILLKLGLDLNVPVKKDGISVDGVGEFKEGEYQDNDSGNFEWWNIDSGRLIIITKADMPVANLFRYLSEEKKKPEKVICLDKIFDGSDEEKTNLVLQMKDAGVEFKTV